MLRLVRLVVTASALALSTTTGSAYGAPARSFIAGPVAPFALPSGTAFDPSGALVARDPCARWGEPVTLATASGNGADLCLTATFDATPGPDAATGIAVQLPAEIHVDPAARPACDVAASSGPPSCPAASRAGTLSLRWRTASGDDLEATAPVVATGRGWAAVVPVSPDGAVTRTVTLDRTAVDPTGSVIALTGIPAELPSDVGPQAVTLTGFAVRLQGAATSAPSLAVVRFAGGCRDALVSTLTMASSAAPLTPTAVTSQFAHVGCASQPSSRAAPASAGVSLAPLPRLTPYFGTQRRAARGPVLGTLRSAYLSGLPPQAVVSIECIAGCGRGARSAKSTVDRAGTVTRRLVPGWPLRRSTRIVVSARAAGAKPATARFRFLVTDRVVRAKRLP